MFPVWRPRLFWPIYLWFHLEKRKIPLQKEDNTKSRKIIVTGASGFVGAHLVVGLANSGYKVVALCGKNSPSKEVLTKAIGVDNLDLSEPKQVAEVWQKHQPAAVIHAAALSTASGCAKNPELAKLANVTATENVVNASKDLASRPLVIYLSTDLVFSGKTAPPGGFIESDESSPASLYAETKYQGEKLLIDSGLPGAVFRIALVYGKRIGGSEGFLKWMRESFIAGNPLNLFTDEWRTPVIVDDIIVASCALLDSGPNDCQTYHIAGPERVSRYSFGERYAETFGFDKKLIIPTKQDQVDSPVLRAADVSLNSSHFSSKFGVSFRDVAQGLKVVSS